MPIFKYKDFATCVAAQKKKGKSDESAHKICGYLQKKAEGTITDAEFTTAMTSLWIEEDVLQSNK